jgi:hypothetical protein
MTTQMSQAAERSLHRNVVADIPLLYMGYNIAYAGFSTQSARASDRIRLA